MQDLSTGDARPAGSIAHLQRTNPKEWARQFREWCDSHDPNLPVLSDEAMSRESIYPDLDRGLAGCADRYQRIASDATA
jgi:hypothetical protein